MYYHCTVKGLEKVPGIFISRLVPGGLAESTGLLAVNDEVLEVNGIEVAGKSLDQVCILLLLFTNLGNGHVYMKEICACVAMTTVLLIRFILT